MNARIKNHIEMLFEKAPKTRKALELKEELLANSQERYEDLINSGIGQEDAIKNVISSIGDVSELFKGLDEIQEEKSDVQQGQAKKAALLKSIAVGIYVFGVVVFLYFIFLNGAVYQPNQVMHNMTGLYMGSYYNYVLIGLILMLLIDIVPTCMLVYVATVYPRYKKPEMTVVENFKEWNNQSKKKKSIKRYVSLVLWAATIMLYFVISVLTYAWYATWVIFFIALCLQAVIELVFRIKEMN